jgi:hypothetical protein
LATLPQNYPAFPRGTSQTARIPVFISQITRVFPSIPHAPMNSTNTLKRTTCLLREEV